MAKIVTSMIFTIDATDIEDGIISVLDEEEIPAEDFLSALTISLEEKNNKAKVVVFYGIDEIQG